MNIDPQVAEICRRVKISDYLINKGVQLIKRGNRYCCKCPLPGHDDHDPSFYITVLSDGTELYRCFGCQGKGNILTFRAAMEKENKGSILKKMAQQTGIQLNNFNFSIAKLEPLPDEVESVFCDEQDQALDISEIAVKFMQDNPTEDVISKVSRMYEMIEQFIKLGEIDKIEHYKEMLNQVISEYK